MSAAAAYIVTLPPGTLPQHAVFLDCARAVEYASAHRGGVDPLARMSDVDRLESELHQLQQKYNALRAEMSGEKTN